jgi:hypothetical protein
VSGRSKKKLDQGNASQYKHALVIWLDIAGRDDAWMEISDGGAGYTIT